MFNYEKEREKADIRNIPNFNGTHLVGSVTGDLFSTMKILLWLSEKQQQQQIWNLYRSEMYIFIIWPREQT